MSKLRDRLPQRLVNPLLRADSYLDRRTGAPDPAREARRQRELGRTPLPTQPAAIQSVGGNAGTTSMGRNALYRTPYGGGQPERLKATRKNASGSPEVVTLATTADAPQTASGTGSWDPPNLAPGNCSFVVTTVPGVANDGSWVCLSSQNTLPAAWTISANPSGTDQVTITICNFSGSTVNLATSAVATRCWKA